MRSTFLAPARVAHAVRAAGAAALLIGYADLARGGLTIAPLALVLAYVVLLPLVLLTW